MFCSWGDSSCYLDFTIRKCFKGKFLVIKLITWPFNLLFFNISQRGQRARVQMFYLLTCWVEKLAGDVNVYGRWAETTDMLLFKLVVTLSGWTQAHRLGCCCGEDSTWHQPDETGSPAGLHGRLSRSDFCSHPSELQQPVSLWMNYYFTF